MPKENVLIEVVTTLISDYDGENNNLSIKEGSLLTLSTAETEDPGYDIESSIYLDFNFENNNPYIINVDADLQILDTNVIPLDALKYKTNMNVNTGLATGEELIFTINKLKPCKTLLYLNLKQIMEV